MTQKKANVFIATTQGLVEIQSITPLLDPDVSSVASINKTSTLAGINTAYQLFVHKPQGIVQEHFGGHAYRINLSQNINQGESWQLGVYLAHFLKANDLFANGQNTAQVEINTQSSNHLNKNDNLIFITSGKVDTLQHKVMPIEQLTKKCLVANATIQQWLKQNKQIVFLAPSDNLRLPIPDTSIQLTPIKSLSEIERICSVFGLCSDFKTTIPQVTSNKVIEKGVPSTESDTVSKSQMLNTTHISNLKTDEQSHQKTDRLTIDAVEVQAEDPSTYQNGANNGNTEPYLHKRKVLIWSLWGIFVSLLLATVNLLNTTFYISNNNKSESKASILLNHSEQFLLIAKVSENRATCHNASTIIIDSGELNAQLPFNQTSLAHLCGLQLLTSNHIQNSWFISETKLLVPLVSVEVQEHFLVSIKNAISTNNSNAIKLLSSTNNQHLRLWTIPLPFNSNKTERYHLLLFPQASDAADLQSLNSYLLSLQQNGKTQDQRKLMVWLNKVMPNRKVYVVSHLLVY